MQSYKKSKKFFLLSLSLSVSMECDSDSIWGMRTTIVIEQRNKNEKCDESHERKYYPRKEGEKRSVGNLMRSFFAFKVQIKTH